MVGALTHIFDKSKPKCRVIIHVCGHFGQEILVLGSEGQIGKPVCKFLEKNGHEVIKIDLKKSRHHDLRFDLYPSLLSAFGLCDFVYYFASDVGGAKYLEKNQDSFYFIDDNIRIMRTVFGALKEYNKPFIFTSSQHYNNGNAGRTF